MAYDTISDRLFNRELECSVQPFTVGELERAINSLKSGKAAGIDGITVEALKHGGALMQQRLLNLCNMVMEGGDPPEDWKVGETVPSSKEGEPCRL
jgi:hypothetical protein